MIVVEKQQPRDPAEQRHRQDEQTPTQTRPAQQAPGQQGVKEKGDDGDVAVEVARERSQGVEVARELELCDGFELILHQRAGDGGGEDRRRDQQQVALRAHQPKAFQNRRPGALGFESRFRDALPPSERARDQGAQAHEHDRCRQDRLGADARADETGEVAAEGGPEDAAAADQREKALRLARREDRAGERPDLARNQHREDADPEIDRDRGP